MPEDGGGKTKMSMIANDLCGYDHPAVMFFAVFLSVSIPKKEPFEQARHRLMEQFASTDQINEVILK